MFNQRGRMDFPPEDKRFNIDIGLYLLADVVEAEN